MVRFTVAVEVELDPMSNSALVAQSILEYLVTPSHLEQYLMLKNIQEEGHTTDPGPQALSRYHFAATACHRGTFGSRRSKVEMSYVQDSVSPEVTWKFITPHTKYFSKAIRVVEIEHGNHPVLQVTCDVVVDYKLNLLASCSGVEYEMQRNHVALLDAMKLHIEASQRKAFHGKKG